VVAASRDFERMQDYLVGRLSDDECRMFEARLAREPALVRELEESLRVREGLAQLRAKGYFAATAARVRRARFWLPAVAAAAVAGLAVFLSWQREMAPSPILVGSVSADDAVRVTDGFTFRPMRGDSVAPERPSAAVIPIRFELDAQPTGSRYRVTLSRLGRGGSADNIDVLRGLALSSEYGHHYLHCFVDAAGLSAGSYRLRVEREGAEADPADYSFNLTAAGKSPSR